MARLISSSHTIISKLVALPLWTIIFFIYTLTLIFSKDGDRWSLLYGWIFIVLWGALALPIIIPLKQVAIEGEQLIVSNCFLNKKMRIDLSNISDVTQKYWRGLYFWLVRIYFKSPTAFGDNIIFIPKMYMSALGNQHPIVDELKQLARLGESEYKESDGD